MLLVGEPVINGVRFDTHDRMAEHFYHRVLAKAGPGIAYYGYRTYHPFDWNKLG
jgi:hypothetical protein